jgi:hypothetical protein
MPWRRGGCVISEETRWPDAAPCKALARAAETPGLSEQLRGRDALRERCSARSLDAPRAIPRGLS